MIAIDINTDKLRKDMIDNYGTAMFNGFPMAIMDLSKVEKASEQELIRMAKSQGVNLDKYRK
ncbi:MAG: hypothetical protein J6A59_13130 [Lachnospiraceae bacterium]|nr:hypothetical protein [Lachnospiraceae bacterium]